jgi:uncharacterized protein YlzI (FlbEa/FlbD family)
VRFAGFIDKNGKPFLLNPALILAAYESGAGRETRIVLINGEELYVNEPLAGVQAKLEEIPDSD